MEHHFNVEIATRYGVTEAILLNRLWFWIEKNRTEERNYHDGKYWTYNSRKAIAELFPYLTEKKVRSALNHLVKEGILAIGQYNKLPFDKTMWYAFTDAGEALMLEKSHLPFGQIDVPKGQTDDADRANRSDQKGRAIPFKDTVNNPVKDQLSIYSDLPDELKSVLMDYEEMRKKIKKPITSDRARKLLLNKLTSLAGDDVALKVRLVEEAILHNWQSVYPIKETNSGTNDFRRSKEERTSVSGSVSGCGSNSGSEFRYPGKVVGLGEES